MNETQQISQETEPPSESNVIPFGAAVERRSGGRQEPPPTDEELAEYRRIRPILAQIVEQWPKLLAEHQAITSNCVIARQILKGDP